MIRSPFSTAKVTELVFALASHMIAAFIFLYHHFALVASSEVILVFHELNPVCVAVPFVDYHQTLLTKYKLTDRTEDRILGNNNKPLAILARTEFQLGIVGQVCNHTYFVVFLLLSNGQRSNVRRLYLQFLRAIFDRTLHNLEAFQVEGNVFVQAFGANKVVAVTKGSKCLTCAFRKTNRALLVLYLWQLSGSSADFDIA